MAKTNNKGFSLIEIVIAVAILSILLTPIIKQFTNTLETSRKAKALQEANETAVYEVETFQNYSKEELDKTYGDPTVYAGLPVDIYDIDDPGVAKSTDLTYSVYSYDLGESVIGAKRDKYTNVVTLDDLSNKVRAYGGDSTGPHYKIAYNLTETDRAKFGNDFKLTNEGMVVRYDPDGKINGVVCTTVNKNDGTDVSYMQNPNEVNLGNMHDLDKNSVALILGGTSSYDSEAYSSLFSKAMDHLRDVDRESWEQALLNVDNESILAAQEDTNTNRLIRIHTDKKKERKDAASPEQDVYYVKVDVYYYYKYTIKGKDGNIQDTDGDSYFEDVISYTVFSQKFYTKDAPEIYFEYQPYCISDKSSNVKYKADDYILFDNQVDECKLYLYKPYKDQMNAGASDDDYEVAKNEGFAFYTDATKAKRVKIHLASTTNNSEIVFDKDGERTDTKDTNRIYIFTNLDIGGYLEGADTYDKEVEETGSKKTIKVASQFVSDSFDTAFNFKSGTQEDVIKEIGTRYPLGNSYIVKTTTDNTKFDPVTPAPHVLYTLSEDVRESERLYTVTVTMTPDKKTLNTVRLSGAKGAN